MINCYEINSFTLAILPINENQTKIIEKDKIFIINKKCMEIINHSCRYYGSSYIGRVEGSKYILESSYKIPIIIDETRNIVFFPTTSPRLNNCWWISLNNVEKFEEINKLSKIYFIGNKTINLNISYKSLKNQILRASYLQNILKKRINA